MKGSGQTRKTFEKSQIQKHKSAYISRKHSVRQSMKAQNKVIDTSMARLKSIIENSEMEPVIINPDSEFVVVTYWWGRGNTNMNTQKPCQDEMEEGDQVEVSAIQYQEMIEDWKQSCIAANCNYLVQEYPEFAVKGGYQMAINAKPMFIKKALESCEGRGVVYIDGDMTVNRYPHIFDTKNVDFMARGWNIDPRANKFYLSKNRTIVFDPTTFETSGGIMFFGATLNSKKLLDMWSKWSEKEVFKGKADDRIISMLIKAKSLQISMNILQLPVEYLWLTDKYSPVNERAKYMKEVHYNQSDIMFEHPACLTSEEKAVEQGAASNRQPKYYDIFINEDIDGNREGGIFFEYILFDNHESVKPWKKYLRYLSTTKNFMKNDDGDHVYPYAQTVDYTKVYGKRNGVAEMTIGRAQEILENLRKMPHILNTSLKTVKVVHSKNEMIPRYENGILYSDQVIPTIIALLFLKKDAIYLPDNYDVNILGKMSIVSRKDDCEFSVNITNDDDNVPIFDKLSPIFFSHKSRVLSHILKITGDITELNSTLNMCLLFVQMIRCNFLQTYKSLQSTKRIRSLDRTFNSKSLGTDIKSFYDQSVLPYSGKKKNLELSPNTSTQTYKSKSPAKKKSPKTLFDSLFA